MNLLNSANLIFSYKFRNLIKWKQLNTVYLNINSPLLSERACKAIIEGIYESNENRVLQETITEKDVLLELGTGLGYNAIFCAKRNNGKVVTFEGNPNLLPLIKENMLKNKVEFDLRNQILVTKAKSEEHVTFNIAEEFWSSSSKTEVVGKIQETVSVESVYIADVLRQYNPTYLLIDIEGGEEDIFEDASFLENSSIRKILLELHPDAIGDTKCSEIIKSIIDKGFSLRVDDSTKQVVYFYK
jgi:FkbM family methyltransferase